MKGIRALLALLLFFSMFVAVPEPCYPATPDEAASYYPVKIGNSWTYRLDDIGSTAKYEVTGRTSGHDGLVVSCITRMIDVVIATESVISEQNGRIAHVSGTDVLTGNKRLIYAHPEVILNSPLNVGATWEYDRDTTGEDVGCRVSCRVVAFVDREVKAGSFRNVYLIQRTALYTAKDNTELRREVRYEYYAPHVGKILEESVDVDRTKVSMELLDYSTLP